MRRVDGDFGCCTWHAASTKLGQSSVVVSSAEQAADSALPIRFT